MNFHTTAPRIREIATTVSMGHRATVHYSYTDCVVGVDNAVVVDKSVEEAIKT